MLHTKYVVWKGHLQEGKAVSDCGGDDDSGQGGSLRSTAGRYAPRPKAETRSVAPSGRLAQFARHSPRQNRLLGALPPEEYERLLPYLEPVPLPVGRTIHSAGSQQEYLYFITAGLVSRSYVTEQGASVGFALTGSEGVIGLSSFLGGGRTVGSAVAVCAGHAYRARGSLLHSGPDCGGHLLQFLLRYTQALITQMLLAAACNRHHSLRQQMCRAILSSVDRLHSNDLSITHQMIADILGVRRPGVTKTAIELQKAGLIQYRRGHIVVLERPRLEAEACECYAVARRAYDRALPERGNPKPLS